MSSGATLTFGGRFASCRLDKTQRTGCCSQKDGGYGGIRYTRSESRGYYKAKSGVDGARTKGRRGVGRVPSTKRKEIARRKKEKRRWTKHTQAKGSKHD